MSEVSAGKDDTSGVDPRAVGRKVAWRIVPLALVLYIVAYLDRANLSFAMPDMKSALQFSPDVFGWGIGLFFAGYLLLEIPGALLVEHWSARGWFARILITWGFCSMGMALVRTPWQFYLARFLLGLAEAGFFPGLIVYFTHWFPRAERGRALAGMIFGVPLSLALGAWMSEPLLQMTAWGLAGWQWLFLIEGLPAVLLGIAVPFLLTDRPRQARWLSAAERAWLEQTLEAERRQALEAAGHATLGQALRRPTVWLLALGILAANTGGYAFGYWLPTTLDNILQAKSGSAPQHLVLRWAALIYLCGLAGVWLSGQSSDRTGERKWHSAAGMVLTGAALAGSVWSGQSWAAVIACLCLVGFFAYTWPSPFWVLPTLTLSASTAAVSIGFINICANVAGMIGPPVIGEMKTRGWDDRASLLFSAACYVLGGIFVALLPASQRSPQTS
jgi:ACS family tartrate transporter-like MFS transporter